MELLVRVAGSLLFAKSSINSTSGPLQAHLFSRVSELRTLKQPVRGLLSSKCLGKAKDMDGSKQPQAPPPYPTAGIITIGDEILKGQTQDTNTFFFARHLHSFGVKVKKVSLIPDDIEIIAKEVAQFSNEYTFVLTSGGIGPTHDDITFEGVAAAFGEKVHPHPTLVQLISAYFKTDDLTSPAMKMAHIPESAVLHFGEDKSKGLLSRYPIVGVKNVTIFPGVPHLLERAFALLGKKLFYTPGLGFSSGVVYVTADEVSIAPVINEAVKKFPSVSFGSYPKLFHSYYNTKVTLESLNPSDIATAQQHLESNLPDGSIIDYKDDTITSSWEHIDRLLESNPNLQEPVKEATDVLKQCLDQYTPDEICICYNGGKDCLAVLHLTQAVMRQQQQDLKIQAVYITEDNAFPQVTEFVQQSINRYDLDCEVLPGPLKSALFTLLEKRPKIKAVIMGTRRSDPYSDTLGFFTHTDKDWPAMMRVTPLLHWKYDNIWDFVRGLYLPYCNLYDRGYTSIGSQNNTLPNPLLVSKDRVGQVMYLPAYKLQQHDMERRGRLLSKQ